MISYLCALLRIACPANVVSHFVLVVFVGDVAVGIVVTVGHIVVIVIAPR